MLLKTILDNEFWKSDNKSGHYIGNVTSQGMMLKVGPTVNVIGSKHVKLSPEYSLKFYNVLSYIQWFLFQLQTFIV